ncbi:B-cell scaffold protein with ankyrin repeats-like isoform X2 [Anguilla anguilla]|uniref:B-cell scaffold protein with ankyrin repeats-like isoform X2 n=2 Tax=Anguilla anguilla TaxID=7936 RepID=UPI0015AFBAEE|nr:B-cell scaffold protein with ankyrin repeats-like isoform X2 [Anguilla anguilla]
MSERETERESETSPKKTCNMNSTEDLLIIYETDAEQWASYLRSVLVGPVPEGGVCCYDIATVSSRREDFLSLVRYRCKLLVLSKGMLEGLCQMRRFFLARVLRPAGSVVVLLCGVESVTPLLQMVPLEEGCLEISSEQDAQEYLSIVTEIVQRGPQTVTDVGALTTRVAGLELKDKKLPAMAPPTRPPLIVLPARVPCEDPGEVYILLQDAVNSNDVEVEFQGKKERTRVKPVLWNEQTLCVKAADFPAGVVDVTLYCGGTARGKATLQYYSTMGEVALLLQKAADPLEFMLQAFQVSTPKLLDQVLSSALMKQMPAGGFQSLQWDADQEGEGHSEDLPTLLHFVAQNGLLGVASVLLQCPGAEHALSIANRQGETPLKLAERHGHTQLQIFLQETLNLSKGVTREDGEDTDIYEKMGSAANAQIEDIHGGGCSDEGGAQEEEEEEEEDPYTPVSVHEEEYDTIVASSKAMIIANRPPVPIPRPETTKEDSTPYITQVFQKKMSQGEPNMFYSLSTKQARGSIPSTYDTMAPSQPPGLQELIELQEQVKQGSLSMDEALERFSDWQREQKGLDSIQQEKLRQLRASIINNREDDENVYDKISIIHHTPDVSKCDERRRSCPVATDFYSKPLKGQHSNLKKADKQ